MIDDPDKTDRLVRELEASLPLEARLSQSLKETLTKQSQDLEIPYSCHVTGIFYMAEEGGIVCELDIGGPDSKNPHIVSITHLSFNKRTPLFRQIDAYQRHRIKKLKRQNSRNY